MKTRLLGRTNLRVTRIGLGLAALGRPGYINLGHARDLEGQYDVEEMRARTWGVLDEAGRLGIRYLDAARSYGRAEEFLGSWLARRKKLPGSYVIGSKWGYTYTADWQVQARHHEIKDHSLAVLRRQIAESRDLLGTHLRLYQIHSATLDSGVLSNVPVLDELALLKGTGLAIGLSLSGPAQAETLRKAMAIVMDGVPLFDCVQATWNLLEPSAGPQLREAHDAGLGVIVKEALANGRLTDRNPDLPLDSLLRRTAKRLEASLDALSIAAVLAQPWVDVVLSGAASIEQLQSNAKALQVTLDGQTLNSLSQMAEHPRKYWQARSAQPWN